MHDIWKGFTEFIRKGAVFLSAFCLAFISCFGVFGLALNAEESEGSSNEDKLKWIVNNPYSLSKFTTSEGQEFRFRFGTNNVNNLVTPLSVVDTPNTVYAFNYRIGSGGWHTVFFVYADSNSGLTSGNSNNNVRADSSYDRLNWTYSWNIAFSSNYQFSGTDSNGVAVTGRKIYYNDVQQSSTGYLVFNFLVGTYMPDDCPRINLPSGQSVNSILSVFSSGDYSYLPWNFSTSSGGMHFSDGTELDPTPTSQYSQIFIVMDNNHDNEISETEVYYYNQTYNTNYDYSSINSDTDFNQMEFLYWVATEINNGNENPGGGSGEPGGSGGGAGAVEGGITVTDSFTQTQTQSIAENAVNVQINNDNGVNQNNYQFLNNLINNSNGGEEGENPFSEAIGNVNKFVGIGRAFAVLVGVVFGWLPWWVTDLVSMMFSMLFVFVIFRLVHVFK